MANRKTIKRQDQNDLSTVYKKREIKRQNTYKISFNLYQIGDILTSIKLSTQSFVKLCKPYAIYMYIGLEFKCIRKPISK